MHELGHYLLADEYTVDWRTAHTGPDIEGRLDRFARAFLLPAAVLLQEWPAAAHSGDVRTAAVKIAGTYLVDMSTLARRLHDLELVDASTANDIRAVQTTQTDIITHDLYPSDEMAGTTQPRVYQKHVIALFEAEKLSRERTLDLLDGTFDDDDLPDLPHVRNRRSGSTSRDRRSGDLRLRYGTTAPFHPERMARCAQVPDSRPCRDSGEWSRRSGTSSTSTQISGRSWTPNGSSWTAARTSSSSRPSPDTRSTLWRAVGTGANAAF